MKQFTPTEAKKLVKNILAEKKKKAEYFQANGTLKGFASAKQFSVFYPIIEDGNVFSFETETRNKVSVEFSDLTSIFESFFPIYCVDIYRLQGSFHTNEFNGTKTRDTIVNIIKNFLDRFDCALVALTVYLNRGLKCSGKKISSQSLAKSFSTRRNPIQINDLQRNSLAFTTPLLQNFLSLLAL